MLKSKLAQLLFSVALSAFTSIALAIVPPTITQPKPGVLHFSWIAPTTRTNGAPIAASEISGYRLYLTNEAAAILIPGSALSYDYTVPVGYVTKTTDAAQISAIDSAGLESVASSAVDLPVGITTPKSLPGAPSGLTVK